MSCYYENISRKANTTNTHGEPERLFDNPTYDGTSTTEQTGTQQAQQPFTYAVYDAVTQPSRRTTQKGRMYNVLQRGKESGKSYSCAEIATCIANARHTDNNIMFVCMVIHVPSPIHSYTTERFTSLEKSLLEIQ